MRSSELDSSAFGGSSQGRSRINEENEETVLKEEQCDKPDLGISILFMPISFTVALEYAISHDNLIITKLQNT